MFLCNLFRSFSSTLGAVYISSHYNALIAISAFTGESDLALHGSDWLYLIGGVLLYAHIDAICESEFSDEECRTLSRGPHSVCMLLS
jgi:hypothetical protein